MTRRARPSETQARLERAVAKLEDLASSHAQVVRDLRQWALGPSSSSSGPGPRNAVSDPTGQAAVNGDEWGRMLERYTETVERVVRDVANLDAIRRTVVAPVVRPEEQPIGLVHCANMHGCPDGAWAEKAGRCNACRTFLVRTGRDRTESRRTA